jgi:hypothetical protein
MGGTATLSTANITTGNVSTLTITGTSNHIGDSSFNANVYGIPFHMTIACSSETGAVTLTGAAVSTITAPSNLIITGTRAYLVGSSGTANLVMNVLYGTSLASLTSIYSGTNYMNIGASQLFSWSGAGSANGTLTSVTGVAVPQSNYIRVTATGSGTAPTGLKVILYYKIVS